MDRQTEPKNPKHSACRITAAQAPFVISAHESLQNTAETFDTANILLTIDTI